VNAVAGLAVFCRCLAFFFSAPFFSARGIPASVRAGSAALLTVVVLSAAGTGLTVPSDPGGIAAVCVRETAVGLLLGLIWSMLFAAVEVGGSLIGLQLGLTYQASFDPFTPVPGAVFDQLFTVMIGLLLFGSGADRTVIGALLGSFTLLPPGAAALPRSSASLLGVATRASAVMLDAGLRLALPVLAITLLIDVMLAVLSRASPQANALLLSLGIKPLLGIWITAASLDLSLGLLNLLITLAPEALSAAARAAGG
jgi:flagellar biosynthetic protein FliR